jgi:hypothetical protein
MTPGSNGPTGYGTAGSGYNGASDTGSNGAPINGSSPGSTGPSSGSTSTPAPPPARCRPARRPINNGPAFRKTSARVRRPLPAHSCACHRIN